MKRAEQAADTRAALIEAAKRLFATRGYLNTKITDITAEAGRSAGSFYNHFTSKEELLEALLADIASASDEKAAAPEHKSDFSDPDAIRYHVAAYWQVHREHAATMLALNQAALVSDDFARTLSRFRRTQLDDLAGHLVNVRNLPASPEVSLTLLVAMIDSLAQVWFDMPEDEAVEVITRFAYRALNARDYPAQRP
ncbi:TetR family transcriptional regulator [Streptomyces hygroscopicus]|uniref:TetR/AcrR family transcriptional regulator n=1 Tax=Streptomyces hygroscopicus TaxID=1912 RepID=UPI00223F4442|nr:TetR/AcrR family transcriptional regulator [Streptomyces hygroscopicus]MCW7941349.1 TetR family transcriptional regulator [Streptomyces hygroscopicus]